MILLLSQEDNPILRLIERHARAKDYNFLYINSKDLVHRLLVDDRVTDNGDVALKWQIGEQAFTHQDVSGVLNLLEQVDYTEFQNFGDDSLFLWRELNAYLAFALNHFPNVINKPMGDELSGATRSLCFQWELVKQRFPSLSIPKWFFGSGCKLSRVFSIHWQTIISNNPFKEVCWSRVGITKLDPEKPYLHYELPQGQSVWIIVLDENIWACPSNYPLSSKVLKTIEQVALSLCRYFKLRWAKVLFFYQSEEEHLTFGSIQPFRNFNCVPAEIRSLVLDTVLSTLQTGHIALKRTLCRTLCRSISVSRVSQALIEPKHRSSPQGAQISSFCAVLDEEPTKILLIASCEDPTAAYFHDIVISLGVPVTWWFAEDVVAVASKVATLRELQACNFGVYYRRPGSSDPELYRTLCLIDDLLHNFNGSVIGNTWNRGTNHSKPLHTAFIGLHSTDSIRSIPTRLQSANLHTANDVVVKAISGEKAEVLSLAETKVVDGVYPIPVQLQQRIKGQNIRVHVCENKVAALRIESPRLDYRFDEDFDVCPTMLPQEVEAWCIEIASREELSFAGIDLLLKDNTYFCLEVNPNPGYHVFEKRMTMKGFVPTISKMLIEHLCVEEMQL